MRLYAPQLVAEHRLQILAFEQDVVAQPLRQPMRTVQRRLVRDVVDAAVEDQPRMASAVSCGW